MPSIEEIITIDQPDLLKQFAAQQNVTLTATHLGQAAEQGKNAIVHFLLSEKNISPEEKVEYVEYSNGKNKEGSIILCHNALQRAVKGGKITTLELLLEFMEEENYLQTSEMILSANQTNPEINLLSIAIAYDKLNCIEFILKMHARPGVRLSYSPEIFVDLVAKYPQSIWPHYFLGFLNLERKLYQNAFGCFTKFLQQVSPDEIPTQLRELAIRVNTSTISLESVLAITSFMQTYRNISALVLEIHPRKINEALIKILSISLKNYPLVTFILIVRKTDLTTELLNTLLTALTTGKALKKFTLLVDTLSAEALHSFLANNLQLEKLKLEIGELHLQTEKLLFTSLGNMPNLQTLDVQIDSLDKANYAELIRQIKFVPLLSLNIYHPIFYADDELRQQLAQQIGRHHTLQQVDIHTEFNKTEVALIQQSHSLTSGYIPGIHEKNTLQIYDYNDDVALRLYTNWILLAPLIAFVRANNQSVLKYSVLGLLSSCMTKLCSKICTDVIDPRDGSESAFLKLQMGANHLAFYAMEGKSQPCKLIYRSTDEKPQEINNPEVEKLQIVSPWKIRKNYFIKIKGVALGFFDQKIPRVNPENFINSLFFKGHMLAEQKAVLHNESAKSRPKLLHDESKKRKPETSQLNYSMKF